MSVGDVNSDARGSGARYNDGKPQLDLIPVPYWAAVWEKELWGRDTLSHALDALSAFQMGDDEAIQSFMASICSDDFGEAVAVLEFGAKKYKAWNWAKGMAWSIPTGCILRHVAAILAGEDTDPESGCTHWGHILCNMIFLAWFVDNYPEGDDRPPVQAVPAQVVTDHDYPNFKPGVI